MVELGNGIVVVKFGSKTCIPCKSVTKTLKELAPLHKDVKFIHVDRDEQPEVFSKYSVMSLPTIIVFDNKIPYDTIIGSATKSTIENKINKRRG